jgi:DNA polymerase III alpha subunit
MNFAKDFKYDLIKIMKHLREFNDEKGKPIIKESRYETIKKKYIPCLEIYRQNSKSEDLANWYYEKSLLGYTYNKTLKDIYSDKRDDLSYVNYIQNLPENSRVTFIGTVRDTYSGYSKNKNKYFRCEIADETGFMTALVFKDKIDECKNLNGGKLPQKTNIVIVKGIRKNDCIFANLIAVQDQKIYTKLSQLKNIDK